jgi:hypothetical protein
MKTRGEKENESYLLKLPEAQGRTEAVFKPDMDKRGGGVKVKVAGKNSIGSKSQNGKVAAFFTFGEVGATTEEQLLSVCMNERKRRQLAGLMDHVARNRNTLAERITLKAYRDILENVGLIEKRSKNITRDVAMALSELTEMAATRVIFVETNATGKKEVLEYPLLHMGTINRTAGVINGIKIGDWFNVGEYLKLPKEEQKGVTYFIKMVEGLDPGIQLWYIIYKKGKRGDLHIQYKTFAKAVGIEGSLEKNPRRTIPGIEKKIRLCLQAGKNPDLWYIEEKKEYDPKGSLVVKKIKQKTTTQTEGGGR